MKYGCELLLIEHDKEKWGDVYSKFGGVPTVNEHFIWPERNYCPMAFVGQLHCRELPQLSCLPGMPHCGILYFFVDATYPSWNYKLPEQVPWHVCYSEKCENAFPGVAPPSVKIYKEFFLRPRKMTSQTQYTYQFGGAPCTFQQNVELQCELVGRNLGWDDWESFPDSVKSAFKVVSEDWQMLLQLPSDRKIGWKWGKNGVLSFWINKNDLKRGYFDRCQMIVQDS